LASWRPNPSKAALERHSELTGRTIMKDVLDADRPFLDQFEEQALVDDEAYSWLLSKVYRDPKIMDVLTSTVLPPPPAAPRGRRRSQV
jgi:hypothetical protein